MNDIARQRQTLACVKGIFHRARAVTANDTALTTDHLIIGDSTAGAMTETLPALASAYDSISGVGQVLAFVLATDGGDWTIDGSGSETIAGSATYVLDDAGDTVVIQAGPSEWSIVATGPATAATVGDGAVTTAKLAADAVTGAKMADDCCDSEHYTDGSIDLAHLSADCVDGTKIADDAIDSEHYADGSIDTAHIADGQVTPVKLEGETVNTVDTNHTVLATDRVILVSESDAGAHTVTFGDTAVAGHVVTVVCTAATTGSYATVGIDSGNVTFDTANQAATFAYDETGDKWYQVSVAGPTLVDTANLAADCIDGTKLADDACDSEHYTDGSIDTAHIAADAIDGTLLADDCCDSEHYTDGSIDTAHIATDAIDGTLLADDCCDSEHYTDGSIDLAHMAANSVDSDQYVDGSIDLAHLSADCVDGTKIADDAVDSEHIVAGSLDAEHYADGSISPVHLASGYRLIAADGALTLAATDRNIQISGSAGGAIGATMTGTHAGHEVYVRMSAGDGANYYTMAVTGGTITLNAANEACKIVYDGDSWELQALMGATFA